MNFQRRVTLASAAAVAVAVALASLATYVLVRNELHRHVNRSLVTLAGTFVAIEHSMPARAISGPPSATGAPYPYNDLLRRFAIHPGESSNVAEIVTGTGRGYPAVHGTLLPLSKQALASVRALAREGSGSTSFDASANGTVFRVRAVGLAPGYALLVTHSLTDVDSTLDELRLILVVLTLGGIALAALLGWFVARTALAPVRRLTDAARHIAQTRDLGERIEEHRRDELGSLAESFNSMLAALESTVLKLDESARTQRRLVADASHELRTPVTSARTNIEILERAHGMPPDERRRLITDVVEQLEELSALINDLIELAREDEHVDSREEVRFDILVNEAIERARRHAPQARFQVALEATLVNGVPARLDRAVNNLLDNAVKFAGTDEAIEVRLHDGELEIRDHGPGIDAEDLPHVFDRFFRGARSRARPGSGLGLAIVRQVAELHAGSVSVAAAPGGGTVVRLRVPVSP